MTHFLVWIFHNSMLFDDSCFSLQGTVDQKCLILLPHLQRSLLRGFLNLDSQRFDLKVIASYLKNQGEGNYQYFQNVFLLHHTCVIRYICVSLCPLRMFVIPYRLQCVYSCDLCDPRSSLSQLDTALSLRLLPDLILPIKKKHSHCQRPQTLWGTPFSSKEYPFDMF